MKAPLPERGARAVAAPVVEQQLREQEERGARPGKLPAAGEVMEECRPEGARPEVIHDRHPARGDAPARGGPGIEDPVHGLNLQEMVTAEVEPHLRAAEPRAQQRMRLLAAPELRAVRDRNRAAPLHALESSGVEPIALDPRTPALEHRPAQL